MFGLGNVKMYDWVCGLQVKNDMAEPVSSCKTCFESLHLKLEKPLFSVGHSFWPIPDANNSIDRLFLM